MRWGDFVRYIKSNPFAAPYRSSNKNKKRPMLLLIAAGILFSVWCALSELGLSMVSQQLTEEMLRSFISKKINIAVSDELNERESSFITLSHSQNGEISSVKINATELNSLKGGIIKKLTKALNGTASFHVPIGSLTGCAVLNGRGPNVPIKLSLNSSVNVSFQTELSSAGINQSCHRITMTVTAESYSSSKRFAAVAKEISSTVLAETVLVGVVPEVALAEK